MEPVGAPGLQGHNDGDYLGNIVRGDDRARYAGVCRGPGVGEPCGASYTGL